MKLSVHQRYVLATGDIVKWFDVWGGYWWTLGPRQERISKATIDVLVRLGCLTEGKSERVFSGRQRANYTVTPIGRDALRAARSPQETDNA